MNDIGKKHILIFFLLMGMIEIVNHLIMGIVCAKSTKEAFELVKTSSHLI